MSEFLARYGDDQHANELIHAANQNFKNQMMLKNELHELQHNPTLSSETLLNIHKNAPDEYTRLRALHHPNFKNFDEVNLKGKFESKILKTRNDLPEHISKIVFGDAG